MADPRVIDALIERRSELSGYADTLQRKLVRVRADIVHVDATLRVLGYQGDLALIESKRNQTTADLFAHGELSRTIMELLRTEQGPFTTDDIANIVIHRKAWIGTDEKLRKLLKNRIRNILERLRKRGLAVSEAHAIGADRRNRWRVAR